MSAADRAPGCPLSPDDCPNVDGRDTRRLYDRDGHAWKCRECGVVFSIGTAGHTIHGPDATFEGVNPRGGVSRTGSQGPVSGGEP